MSDKLESLARLVIARWEAWCEADGWDNNEYDDFSESLNDLESFLSKRPDEECGIDIANAQKETP